MRLSFASRISIAENSTVKLQLEYKRWIVRINLGGDMTRVSISIVLCLIITVGAMAKSKSNVRDVTGCLSKGDSAKEFLIKGNDGGAPPSALRTSKSFGRVIEVKTSR